MHAIILVILPILIKIIDGYYLQDENNFQKPKLERNNIVNKGVWIRNKHDEDISDKNNMGNFIFRANSLDADNVMQNTYDGNAIQDTPYVTNYVQRSRRSPDHIRKRRPRKSMKTGNNIKNSVEDAVLIKSKLVSDLKPTSVFNEYPYEVAILLNNESDKIKIPKKDKTNNNLDIKHANKTYGSNTGAKEEIKIVSLNINTSISTDVPKRSKKYNHVGEDMTNFNMVEGYNTSSIGKTTTDNKKQERYSFPDKEGRDWKQIVPLTDNNFYKIVPKEPEKSKSITERGLIKVISMLTKTFKKIMKQHSEIKSIHENLMIFSQSFDKKLAEVTSKFEDFDSKYADMIQFNDKLKFFENELHTQKNYFDIKQKAIRDTFSEFQEQQKKFLVQQRQFYAIQKLMLSQNEKINAKQNVIAQTQSQISHRQNNFARILKKAKQIVNDNKSKINQSYIKPQNKYIVKGETVETTVIPTTTSTTSSPNTESMKINLFSIATKTNKLENHDALIIKEKDDKQIDDLVYKYYFNNTFIDALMKSKILKNYAMHSDSVEIENRSKLTKNKRNELEATIMFPVNNSLSDTPLIRERRWINHFSKNKYRGLNRHRKYGNSTVSSKNQNKINDEKNVNKNQGVNELKNTDQLKSDPFTVMAISFCNGIGQNTDEQVLKWCVEKALRRLKPMEMTALNPPAVTLTTPLIVTEEFETTPQAMISTQNTVTVAGRMSSDKLVPPVTITKSESLPTFTLEPEPKVSPLYVITTPAQATFFPDNDELELNLKQYEIKPDTEGNVYYDGSLHISDYGRLLADNSAAASDIMPGLMDSNSRVDIDPVTFDIQAKRRAYVRKMNENILKQIREQ